MQIDFLDSKLRKLCENSREAEKKLGSNCAKKLHSRLSDLEAVAHVRELNAGRPHPLEGDRLGEFALDLADGKRLVFKPDHESVPQDTNDNIDWSQVTEIKIIYIGDYHD
jgi:proteic killer suppression protein